MEKHWPLALAEQGRTEVVVQHFPVQMLVRTTCPCAFLLQAATAAVKSLKRQLQRCDQQEQVADMRQEITLLAESMSDCLQQVG